MSHFRTEGLKVKLMRVPGLTPKSILRHPYYFQCPPTDQVAYSYGHNSQTYSTIPTDEHGGDYKRIGGRKLKTVTFPTLIAVAPQFAIRSHHEANRALGQDNMADLVQGMIDLAQGDDTEPPIFRLLMSHDWNHAAELSMLATLPDLGVTERGSEPDGRYLDITFEEWRDGTVSRRTNKKKRSGGKTWPKVVALKVDDTLYGLAHDYYGKSGAGRPGATVIAKANKITDWGFDDVLSASKRWRVGDKITIPKPPDD